MVGVERERRLVLLLRAQAEEALDGRVAVRAVHPLAGRAPLELRGLRRFGQRFARAEQRLDVDAVVDRLCCVRHRMASFATGNEPILTQNRCCTKRAGGIDSA